MNKVSVCQLNTFRLAGDKCARESECMPFSSYMQLAKEMAVKRVKQRGASNVSQIHYDTIVLSSESKDVLEARHNCTSNSSFPFRFVTNDQDAGQGHGKPKRFKNRDHVMVSTMAALKMQLMPDTLILNSCSNFHKLMLGFIEGCGMQQYVENLLNNDNKKFRLQCF